MVKQLGTSYLKPVKQLALPKGSQLLATDFIWGSATSSYQIEGARETRELNIWDVFCQQPGRIKDGSNGDSACEHVAHWQQDVDLIESLSLDAYRLSLSWPRLIKSCGTVNQTGLAFYTNLVKALWQRNIKVFVTFYHWDLPQYLADKGGWLNRETALAFADYVEQVTPHLAPYVYSFATLNEPFCSAQLGYEDGVHAPGLTGAKNGRAAAHHLLLAHGLAMQVLTRVSPSTENGIVLNFSPCDSATQSDDDITAARYADDYLNQWYIKPILTGHYPIIESLLPEHVKPPIMPGDLDIISHPIDFLGVNYYTRHVVKACSDNMFKLIPQPSSSLTAMGWEIVPESFTKLLVDLAGRYTLPTVYITENGAAFDDVLENNQVIDIERINYLQSHLLAVHNAVEQGVNIKGYFAWSLLDNFEWAEGYSKRFGIVYVDYNTQQRIVKHSGLAYKALIQTRNLAK